MIFFWGMAIILLGDRLFENIAWGFDHINLELDYIRLGRPILTTPLLGVLLVVDLLGAVRQGCTYPFLLCCL